MITKDRLAYIAQGFVIGALLCITWLSVTTIAARAQSPACYGELTAGTNMTAIKTDVGISAATKGVQGSIGAGCDLTIDRFLIGALGRYELTSGDGTLMGLKVDAKPSWQMLGRAGYWLNPSVVGYGVLGISGTEFAIEAVQNQKHRGIVYGGGVDVNLMNTNTWLRLEWNRTNWHGEDYGGARVIPTSDMVRAGVLLKFGLPK